MSLLSDIWDAWGTKIIGFLAAWIIYVLFWTLIYLAFALILFPLTLLDPWLFFRLWLAGVIICLVLALIGLVVHILS